MKLERTHDMEVVRILSTHPEVAAGLADDRYDPSTYAWERADVPGAVYLLVREEDAAAGLLTLHPNLMPSEWAALDWATVRLLPQWQGHIAMLAGYRGRVAVEAVHLVLAWMWRNTAAEEVLGYTPETNPAAALLARWAGMERIGWARRAYKESGRWVDAVVTRAKRPAGAHMEVAA